MGLLGLTQIDWKQFIEASREAVGYSPTRGLDAVASPTHRDPAAFIACIDLENKPLEALRNGLQRGLFRHYFMSFMCRLEEPTVRIINEETHIATLSTSMGRGEMFVILSGTMDQWVEAVAYGCREGSNWEFRSCMNGVYNILLNAGFREAFSFKKIENRDGTFTLCQP